MTNEEIIAKLQEEHMYYCKGVCTEANTVCENCSHGMAFRIACRRLGDSHGCWLDDGDPLTWTCSVCSYSVLKHNNTEYCPKCGAIMDLKAPS